MPAVQAVQNDSARADHGRLTVDPALAGGEQFGVDQERQMAGSPDPGHDERQFVTLAGIEETHHGDPPRLLCHRYMLHVTLRGP
ncbi:hypothetical protein OHA21_11350 [Actinoplanes sp. NBC_00393]|uniref:hypothetical protein n=1 Tax=Actinoplanes sp. NBC_00393 TaxID=2975953 RepID=UPI002E1B063A